MCYGLNIILQEIKNLTIEKNLIRFDKNVENIFASI